MIARIVLVALGLAAISWGTIAFHTSRHVGPVERVAKRIIYGEPFRAETLAAMQPAIVAVEADEFCRPTALRAAAIVRLRRLESAIHAAARNATDDNRVLLRQSMLRSLGCAPADPYLWLVLYWTEMSQHGLSERHLDYLRMSYETGPNEAWVALKRNPLALAAFPKLPADLADRAVDEFVSLVATRRVYPEAVRTLRGPGWPIRNIILPKLATLPEGTRRDFSNALYRAGLDLEIPGVPPRDSRPWR